MTKFCIILYMLLFVPIFTMAQTKGKNPKAEDLVKITLLTDHKQVLPGTPFLLGIKFTIEKDWHTYWLNPGDAGLAPEFEIELPNGWKSLPTMFPTPKKIPFDDFANYGYETEVIHFIPIHSSSEAIMGNHQITVKVSFLVCKEECIPGKDTVTKLISISHYPEIDTRAMADFSSHLEQLPIRNVELNAYAVYQNDAIMLNFSDDGIIFSENLTFFPFEEGYMLNGSKQRITKNGNNVSIQLLLDRFREETPGVISGLIVSDNPITDSKKSKSIIINNIKVINK